MDSGFSWKSRIPPRTVLLLEVRLDQQIIILTIIFETGLL